MWTLLMNDLFHVSFGIIRQLGKDLIYGIGANRTNQTHQSGLLREGFPYSWFGGYSMVP